MARESLRRLPKAVLHDHLDGGVRPATVLELAEAVGYEGLPAVNAGELGRWFYRGDSASLPEYLEAFDQTLAVMQTADALERVAYEAIIDLADDGVVYAEIRFAPMLHQARGLTPEQVLDAVLVGIRSGSTATGMEARVIVAAMRQHDDSAEVARVAASFRGRGVVAFDLAGPEAGFPASLHREACRLAGDSGLGLTIHAGEGDGVPSVADALECGAERLGHGVRIAEDVVWEDGAAIRLGPVAAAVRDRRIALEVSPSSNLDTKAYPSIAEHPVGNLHRAGFTVTLNTDNRLMSGTSMSREFSLAVEHQGFTVADLRTVTLQAVDAAFCDDETRNRLRERLEDGYRGVS